MSAEWTPERIQELTDLWAEGLPAGEIGRRLGVTKNAIVGKVHRLGLPKRPSPIKREAGAARPRKPRPQPAPRPERTVVTLGSLKAGMCSWPDGEPGTADFRFCGKPSVAGKPYCADHCAKAYVRSSKAEADARTEKETAAA